jgi:hypothetical protein
MVRSLWRTVKIQAGSARYSAGVAYRIDIFDTADSPILTLASQILRQLRGSSLTTLSSTIRARASYPNGHVRASELAVSTYPANGLSEQAFAHLNASSAVVSGTRGLL